MHRSPLHSVHASTGARFVDFGGWEMPVQYEGVLAEHQAVRGRVGVFDVSHLGRFSLMGAGTTALLRRLLCNDITRVAEGRAQYTMALNERGGVEDDIIVWRWSEDDAWVLPNGANYRKILDVFAGAAPDQVTVEPLVEKTALLAVQGPAAPDLLERVLGKRPGRFRLLRVDHDNIRVWAAGTGYTGEMGAELAVPVEAAAALWTELVEAGAIPCGLGARDTLRLEAGLPLWGQDLDPETTPLEAGLDWVVSWDHEFTGRDALLAQQRDGLSKQLVPFEMEGRQIARHGHSVRAGAARGEVSSGNFSPVLGHGIGFAYLAPPEAEADLEIEIRGAWLPARRAQLPFIGKD